MKYCQILISHYSDNICMRLHPGTKHLLSTSLGKCTVRTMTQYYLGKMLRDSNRKVLIKLVAASFTTYVSIMAPELSCKLKCLLLFYPDLSKELHFSSPHPLSPQGPKYLKISASSHPLPGTKQPREF